MADTSITMPKFAELIRQWVPNPTTIMEIGALDGADAVFLKSQFPDADVYAIEALRQNFDRYLLNLPGVTAFNALIGAKNEQVTFYEKRINGLHGMFDRGSRYGTKQYPVQCYRLDDFCANLGLPAPDVYKIDVEGAEYEIVAELARANRLDFDIILAEAHLGLEKFLALLPGYRAVETVRHSDLRSNVSLVRER